MYLLHTASLRLHEFVGANMPKYAILSHQWGKEEALFRDISDSGLLPLPPNGLRELSSEGARAPASVPDFARPRGGKFAHAIWWDRQETGV